MLSLGPKAGDGARAPRPTAGEVDQTVTTLDDGTATNPDWPTRCASAERMPNTRGSLNVALRIREHDCRRVGLAGSFQAPDGEPDRERVGLVHGSPDSSSHHRVNRSRSTASTASGAAGTSGSEAPCPFDVPPHRNRSVGTREAGPAASQRRGLATTTRNALLLLTPRPSLTCIVKA